MVHAHTHARTASGKLNLTHFPLQLCTCFYGFGDERWVTGKTDSYTTDSQEYKSRTTLIGLVAIYEN